MLLLNNNKDGIWVILRGDDECIPLIHDADVPIDASLVGLEFDIFGNKIFK